MKALIIIAHEEQSLHYGVTFLWHVSCRVNFLKCTSREVSTLLKAFQWHFCYSKVFSLLFFTYLPSHFSPEGLYTIILPFIQSTLFPKFVCFCHGWLLLLSVLQISYSCLSFTKLIVSNLELELTYVRICLLTFCVLLACKLGEDRNLAYRC